MSGNTSNFKSELARTLAKPRPRIDRRVQKTRDTLGGALMDLVQEKPFDEITVQQVLDRAGVGRSTFYTHFTDKDDLFISDVEDFFEMFANYLNRRQASPRRLAPIQEFFAHIADAHVFVASLKSCGKMNDVIALGRGIFARSIQQRLEVAGIHMEPIQLAIQAHAIAGSMFALLDWWLDHGMKPDPQQMDDLFHTQSWNGVRAPAQAKQPKSDLASHS